MEQRIRLLTILSSVVSIGVFIGFTGYEYHKKTGSFQYSAFGGWQLAANSLYAYANSSLDDPSVVPARFRELHKVVNEKVRIYKNLPRSLRPDSQVGVFYLWDFQSPLRLYQVQNWRRDSTTAFFEKWASMAPLYGAYGRYLITKHPKSFVINYVWPNVKRYYAPPAQFMGTYNLGNETVDSIAAKWFGWSNNKLPAIGTKTIWIAKVFTILTAIINVMFVAGFLAFIGLSGYKNTNTIHKRTILCTLGIWISNTVFSVISAPIELRYQLFPLTISLLWTVLFIGHIIKMIRDKPETNDKANEYIQSQLV
jgi:hypothetical protein